PVYDTKYYKEIVIQMDYSSLNKGEFETNKQRYESYKKELMKDGYHLHKVEAPKPHDPCYYYFYKKEVILAILD
ncbi:hypothetical protein ACQH8C_23875, partial [Escherichia coli]|uniref:hypothetical protein n=1 Tax=Escherichia coli TaxID=562 RepID=UPI003CF02C7F